jgi:hypothetical protein
VTHTEALVHGGLAFAVTQLAPRCPDALLADTVPGGLALWTATLEQGHQLPHELAQDLVDTFVRSFVRRASAQMAADWTVRNDRIATEQERRRLSN